MCNRCGTVPTEPRDLTGYPTEECKYMYQGSQGECCAYTDMFCTALYGLNTRPVKECGGFEEPNKEK